MMMNLFSNFDPSSSSSLSLNWTSLMLCTMFLPVIFWMIPSRLQMFLSIVTNFILKDISNNINHHNKKLLLLFFTIFTFILLNNFLGLFPYVFTATSHMSITLTLSLSSWLTLMSYGWWSSTNNMFIHLVPNGTPMSLSSFMVIIESVSNIIRPLTLAVRLSANMIAGHLLISLLSEISEVSQSLFIFTLPILVILMILEVAVAMIQSYVFITLLSLYMSEIN